MNQDKGMIILENNKPYCPECFIGMETFIGLKTDGTDVVVIQCINPYCPNYHK